jgi:hypothetical protein
MSGLIVECAADSLASTAETVATIAASPQAARRPTRIAALVISPNFLIPKSSSRGDMNSPNVAG